MKKLMIDDVPVEEQRKYKFAVIEQITGELFGFTNSIKLARQIKRNAEKEFRKQNPGGTFFPLWLEITERRV